MDEGFGVPEDQWEGDEEGEGDGFEEEGGGRRGRWNFRGRRQAGRAWIRRTHQSLDEGTDYLTPDPLPGSTGVGRRQAGGTRPNERRQGDEEVGEGGDEEQVLFGGEEEAQGEGGKRGRGGGEEGGAEAEDDEGFGPAHSRIMERWGA